MANTREGASYAMNFVNELGIVSLVAVQEDTVDNIPGVFITMQSCSEKLEKQITLEEAKALHFLLGRCLEEQGKKHD